MPWRRRIPAGLIGVRFALALALPLLAFVLGRAYAPLLVALLVLGVLTDVFDGILARRWGVATARLRRWDSQTDLIFWLGCLVALIVVRPHTMWHYRYLFVSFLMLEALCYAVSFWRFGRETCTHAYTAKAWGITLTLAFSAILLDAYVPQAVALMYGAGLLSYADVLLIVLLLPTWQHDVKSTLHVIRLRRQQRGLGNRRGR